MKDRLGGSADVFPILLSTRFPLNKKVNLNSLNPFNFPATVQVVLAAVAQDFKAMAMVDQSCEVAQIQ